MPIRAADALVRTDANLYELWQSLMGPGGLAGRTLWLLFVDADGRLPGVLMPIEDLPEQPHLDGLRSLAAVLDESGPADASVPALLSRPGPAAMSTSDRAWARAIRAHLGRHLRQWPVHLATRDRLQVFAPDDLIG